MNLDFNSPGASPTSSMDDDLADDIFGGESQSVESFGNAPKPSPELGGMLNNQADVGDPLNIWDDEEDPQNPNSNGDEGYVTLAKSELNKYLQSSGIKDIDNIRFQDEKGTEYYMPFEDLSEEEKISILRGDLSDYDLSDDEIQLLNAMRSNNMTPEDLEDYIGNYYLENYSKQMQPDLSDYFTYEIDDYSDDELYVADLQSRFPNATDDEIIQMYDQAKANSELYSKAVQDLRGHYRQKEDQHRELEKQERERQYQEQEYAYQNSIQDSLTNFNNISELHLEDSDKQQIWDALVHVDSNGQRVIESLLDDPNNLVKAAWFLLYGEESINALANYYKKEISNSRKTTKNSFQNQYKSITVPKKQSKKTLTLDDIDF